MDVLKIHFNVKAKLNIWILRLMFLLNSYYNCYCCLFIIICISLSLYYYWNKLPLINKPITYVLWRIIYLSNYTCGAVKATIQVLYIWRYPKEITVNIMSKDINMLITIGFSLKCTRITNWKWNLLIINFCYCYFFSNYVRYTKYVIHWTDISTILIIET